MKTIRKRKRQRKTDYGKRIKLLKSRCPRIVIRKTNRYIIAQYVTSKEAQDKIELGITSKNLLKEGWPENAEGSLKSIPACYLTGLLMGKIITKESMETPIIDMGMQRSIYKTRIYAFINGLIDAGVKIKCEKEAFPEENKIKGKYMKNKIPFDEIKKNIEKK